MSRQSRKYIEDNAVGGAQMRLDNNQTFRARNAADNADVPLFKLNTSNELEFLTQPKAAAALALPSADKDYVTVEWVNNYIELKRDPKEAVDYLVDTNLPLTGVTNPLTIQGDDLEVGDTLGLIGQTDASENGPYFVASLDPYVLTRTSDFNESNEVTKGAYFPVIHGSYAGYTVILTTNNPIVLDTTDLTFVAYPSADAIQAGDMLIKVGNVISVDLASLSGLESTNSGNAAGQLRVKTDTAAAEKDQTTRRDPSTGAVMGKKDRRFTKVLDSGDITNQYLDLTEVAAQDSVRLQPAGAGGQIEGTDFSVNYTGGAGSKTRVTFLNGLATGGVSALAVGESVTIYYRAFV